MSFVARASFKSLARRVPTALRKYTTHSQLPEEHRMVYEMCRKFADEELAPNAREWDQKHEFPKEAVTKLVSGLFGSTSSSKKVQAGQDDSFSHNITTLGPISRLNSV